MARFRSHHQRSSGPGVLRLFIWVIALALVLIALFVWMRQIGDMAP
jgi:hypothetical protein